MTFTRDVVVVGGCGRAGLPLGIAFADRGLSVALHDVNAAAVETVQLGEMPFMEEGAAVPLQRAVADGRLVASADPAVIADAENVVIVVGTEIDEHLNPDPQRVLQVIEDLSEVLADGQLIVLRSTVYPGVTKLVERRVERLGKDINVAFCPERIAEGRAMQELAELPQIVAGRTPEAVRRADSLFRNLTDRTVHVEPEEAELAKLFSNVWRYTKFAVTNQFFMIANDYGLDYERIRDAMARDYARAADLPSAGFAAGPCLFKDTMQLAAFTDNNFVFGHAAMLINEGLPPYLVSKLAERYDLTNMTVGILGMAFKAESDDRRSSLSYKLKRILKVRAAAVLCTDPYVKDDEALVPLEKVLADADLLIIGAPHNSYAGIEVSVPVVDIWNLRGDGVRV